jgi:hypothetical protein
MSAFVGYPVSSAGRNGLLPTIIGEFVLSHIAVMWYRLSVSESPHEDVDTHVA